MKLKDILNMKEYLENDCYCPGEIYSSDGFFFEIFEADDTCKMLGVNDDLIAVVCKTQVLLLAKENNCIVDSVRYDATENNMRLLKALVKGEKPKGKLDIFPNNTVAKDLKKIMQLADAVIID